ncbi:hypothetical protein GCM10012275_57430 [Longimycelium tulufanense]|uniref:Uncharacterized protein n=1 Tax=Longimycelium tulufanense TaxID=907463 RepID=A0A8J3FZD5_9PSEU|nr:hypothetical protein [Longimycelium tulufanense]GGM79369.1 hypothetical protein GCM10012275_57430 [Longimycelium tulufanense]
MGEWTPAQLADLRRRMAALSAQVRAAQNRSTHVVMQHEVDVVPLAVPVATVAVHEAGHEAAVAAEVASAVAYEAAHEAAVEAYAAGYHAAEHQHAPSRELE